MTGIPRKLRCYLPLFLLIVYLGAASSQEQNSSSRQRWGPWTDWSSCSVSCGQGVAYRKRLCHNAESRTSCHGQDKQHKPCRHNCTANYKDYRTLQCEKYNGRYYGGKRYYWDALINPYNRCELACKARGPVKYYARFQETVPDGTPCKEDTQAVCIQGRCLDVGCDGIAGSGTTVDQCGICGGGGKSCRIISGIFTRRHLDKYGYNLITTIPSGACNINITELSKSRNYLALKVAGENGLFFLNGNHRLSPSGTMRGAGTDFQYGRSQNRHCPGECVFADGPTTQGVEVQLLYYHHNPGIMYQFTIPKHKMGEMIKNTDTDDAVSESKHRSRQHQNHHRSNHGHHGSHNHHSNRPGHQTSTSAPVRRSSDVNHQQRDSYMSRRRQSRRRIIARRRDALGNDRIIQHGQSPQYIPAYDRNQQLQLGNERRIIPRTYDNQRQPVSSAYADRYSNGRYRTNTNPISRSSSSSQRFLPHSQTLRRTNPSHRNHDQRQTHRSHASTNSHHHRSRTDPSYISRSNRLTNLQTSSSSTNYNNIQAIPSNRLVGGDVYIWKISGLTECSRTCGGGYQETKILCVKRSSGFVVTEENCDPNQLPPRQRVSCNNQPCPPGWEPDEWSECSSTCGKGIQTRTVECKRRISPTLSISVTANLCLSIPRPAVSRMCEIKPCAAWKIGKWEKCSTECGLGERTRTVKCESISGDTAPDHQCGLTRPEHKEICDMGSCAEGWYHTKWTSQCNAECGPGHYVRKTFCSGDDGGQLPEAKCSSGKKPRTKKSCKDNPPCGGKWFGGPWSRCNSTCGYSVKKRDVVCMKKLGSKLHTIVSEVNCVADLRPVSEEICPDLPPCQPEWYMTPWGSCSASCNTGVKNREVKCLDSNLQPSPECPKRQKPSERQSCNKQSCQSRSRSRAQAPAAITNRHIQKDAGGGAECKDYNSGRCLYVKQARLCRYSFYKEQCCKACQEYILEKHH